ncbi:MAG: DinB family protein [Acidobacteriota bacterium]
MEFDISRSIEVLAATPSTLQALLSGLSEEWTHGPSELPDPSSAISTKQGGGLKKEWQPYDIIGHLIHGEETDWIPRARIILAQGDDPTFVSFDRFAQFENSAGKSLAQLLDKFEKLRADNVDILHSWNLSDHHLSLEATHPELGRVTLRQLIATWLVHDLNHVRQIATALAKRYAAEVGPWQAYLSILSP